MSTTTNPSVEPFPVIRVGRITVDRTKPSWLIRELWGAQAVGFIGGTPKSFKTWMALELAVAVASGRPCLGRFKIDKPGHVLVYAAEDSAADIRRRVAGIAQARKIDLSRLAVGLITEPVLQLDQSSHQRRLVATLAKVKPRLLNLDPLVRLHSGDENSSADTSMLLAFLRGLQREHGVAIVVVHHVRKSASSGQPGQALRGSGDLHAWADSNLFLLHRKGRLELHAEHRSHPAPAPMAVTLHTKPEHLVVQDIANDDMPTEVVELRKRIVHAISDGPITRANLRQRIAIRNESLGSLLAQLEDEGRITRSNGLLTVPRSRV
ncbi:MAG: AAA family ATPase [Oligoflexia bacterium]|nr:AAA family ATPase [Oligoflexia bacterium]